MTRNTRAYLLAFVQDDAIVGFGVFSEDRPSHIGAGYWLTVDARMGTSYEAARASVLADALQLGGRFGPRCKDALARLAANPDSRGERLETVRAEVVECSSPIYFDIGERVTTRGYDGMTTEARVISCVSAGDRTWVQLDSGLTFVRIDSYDQWIEIRSEQWVGGKPVHGIVTIGSATLALGNEVAAVIG